MCDATSDTRYAISDTPSAFDQIALDYDRQFTDTQLARALRGIVWGRLAAHIRPGMHILEIGCGTGEDAVWLAERGARVVATDISPAMLDVALQKAERAGVSDRIDTRILDAALPVAGFSEGEFGMAASNFGALNCVHDQGLLARALSEWVQPGGKLIFVFLSRWCAWEIAWHLLHLQPRAALRRLRPGGIDARVGDGTVHVWYPSIGEIHKAFRGGFRLTRVTGLGVFLPPSYLEPIVAGRPRLFRLLARLERTVGSVFLLVRLADHVILEFERVGR